MKKEKMYRYLGRNGMITTWVELIDTTPLPMVRLSSDAGNILTNGEQNVYSITVFPEEVEQWQEVPKPVKEQDNNN